MKKQITEEEARLRLAGLCARGEQCEYDLRRKLATWNLPPDAAQRVIEFLVDGRFLDNTRFASAFARDKVKFSHWGRLKIRAALTAKRIPSDIITAALDSIDEEDYRRAVTETAKARLRTLRADDPDLRVKLYRHILSRGFESKYASAILSRLRHHE